MQEKNSGANIIHHVLVKVKVSANGGDFFGPGVAKLLELTDQYSSLRRAAQEMNMSYSKAFYVVKSMEKNLGVDVTSKNIGGKSGGGSTLTPAGKDFLERFNAFEREVQQSSSTLFEKYFGEKWRA